MSPRLCTALLAAVLGAIAVPVDAAAFDAPAALPDEVILEFEASCAPQTRLEILSALGALETTALGAQGRWRDTI